MTETVRFQLELLVHDIHVNPGRGGRKLLAHDIHVYPGWGGRGGRTFSI